ncbi:MAG: S41 family peptidase [Candidatus Obscuribacterales bacterium]|nr:S41 family peptidase [Candidatus Obscuribacterales bacterium]
MDSRKEMAHKSKPGNKLILRLGTLAICGIAGFTYLGIRDKGKFVAVDPMESAFAQTTRDRDQIPPQELYHKAWGIIKDTYYDQKFNGQNWTRWEHRYDGKLKTQDDSHKAIETMLASLGDPYTRFLNEEAFGEEKNSIQAHLFGVGMQLGMNKEHKVVVIAPIEDTPAARAGMHSGDEIIEVDKKPVKGQSLDQVVKQIRGEKGTKVNITYLRTVNGAVKKDAVDLVRAEIPVKAVVKAEVLPGNVGYIRLDSFISQKATQEVKDALAKLGNVKGLILDLRNNPGGLLANAVEIANMFLDRGVIVSTIDADGYKTSQLATRSSYKTEVPTVLLINKGSASASEILSGALRDNGRAKLIGETSFGKGLVQAINNLGNKTGVNVTIARYLTPNDTDIHKTGIVPDYEVKISNDEFNAGKGPWWFDPTLTNFKRSPSDGKDVQLVKAIEVLNKMLAGNPTVVSDAKNSTEAATAGAKN